MLEFDDGNPLTVFRKKTFMRNVAGHRFCQFDHAVDKSDIFVARVGSQARTKDSHDHGESPCRAMLAHLGTLDQFRI
jgi:hypothetical protein